jgi:hypothetical protein
MEGILFVAALLAGVTIYGIRSREPRLAPGPGLALALVVACAVYLFA